MKELVTALLVIHHQDEAGSIHARVRAVAVRHHKAQVVVFDVGADARMGLGHAAEFGLPVAIEDNPIDVAAARVGLPSIGLRRIEPDVRGGADRIVGVRHDRDWPFTNESTSYTGSDAL